MWCCRAKTQSAGKEPTRQCGDFFLSPEPRRRQKRTESPQKWLLEDDLKFNHRTALVGKDSLKVFYGLADRIGLGTFGCSVLAAQAAPHRVQPSAQPVHQMVKGLQSK